MPNSHIAALVPVLIGVVGTFNYSTIDMFVRLLAIMLSISSTVCNATEHVYSFRTRGQVRIAYADRMNSLYQYYDSM